MIVSCFVGAFFVGLLHPHPGALDFVSEFAEQALSPATWPFALKIVGIVGLPFAVADACFRIGKAYAKSDKTF